jgi:XTP/dITP diphosphohydrolase
VTQHPSKAFEPLYRIVLATHNQNKVRELRQLFEALPVELLTQPELPEPIEDGDSFVANALIKALAFARACDMPSLADDSGLEVDALGGAPGVHSARFASGPDGKGDSKANNEKLLRLMSRERNRSARFRCALVLALPKDDPIEAAFSRLPGAPQALHVDDPAFSAYVFEGRAEGRILRTPVGQAGFGYDPLFLSDDLGLSFAQVEGAKKNAVSHRGRALAAFFAALERATVLARP